MKRAEVVEVDFSEFNKQLNHAKRSGDVIEPASKEVWNAEVKKRDIKAKAFEMIAIERYQAEELFLLKCGDPWDGLFAIDRDTRICVKFVVTEIK